MKTFKICKKNSQPVISTPIIFGSNSLTLSGGNICLTLSTSEGAGICVGDKIRFVKYASGNTGQMLKVCDEDVVIVDKAVTSNSVEIYFEYTYIQPLTIASFISVNDASNPYKYKVYFASEPYIVPGDFEKYKQEIGTEYLAYVKNNAGNTIALNGLALCYPYEVVSGRNITITGNDCCSPQNRLFNYETMERNSFLAKEKTSIDGDFTPIQGDKVFLSANPYYFSKNNKIVLFDNVVIEKYTDYLSLGVVMEDDYDAKRMFQEYQVNELFVKKIKNSIIPDFIDLEKVKYAPAFSKSDSVLLATGLTFNLHFRSRIQGEGDERHVFEDTWHFNDATNGWNGNGFTAPGEELDIVEQSDLYSNPNFVNSSNLIGYLDFTDDDVYNQKNRIKQTFIRLSFYDDPNPLTQNLLYYSTVFFDSGDLYGKYVKRLAALEDSDPNYNHEENPVVWSPTGESDSVSAVTSQLMVNDEYDMTKSGEGFNIYLFRQDAPIENHPQDIYMKVEFNHAGNGRTVPLIFWKKDGNKPIDLNIGNYLENLYIKVRISLSEKGYVYSFPDVTEAIDNDPNTRCNGILWENERIVLNLFEPRILSDSF